MSYSIIVIPDTQGITQNHPDKFKRMARWIVDQAETLQVRMVLHLGDVVNCGADAAIQYVHAKEALDHIDESNIPMLIAPGNHDYDNQLQHDRSANMFNNYFGIRRYEGKAWYGGAFNQQDAANVYARLEINGVPHLFLSLEFGPRDDVLAWADDILNKYDDHRAIIITHCYMYMDGTRNKPGDAHNPKVYPGATGANDGEDMWNKCFKTHRNVSAVYSGHQIPDNISYRIECGKHGNPVFQSFQNWQSAENGGEGRMRIITYHPDGRVEHDVYNPQTESYEWEEGYSINFSYDQLKKNVRESGGVMQYP